MARIEKEVSWDSSFWDRLDSSLKFTSQELLLAWSPNNYFVIIHKSHIQGTKITFREGIGVDRLSVSQTIWPRTAMDSNIWISSKNLEYFKKLVPHSNWTLILHPQIWESSSTKLNLGESWNCFGIGWTILPQ